MFSIVIGTRNRPGLLERALVAVAGQTFADYEVLVVDDGSAAATRAGYGDLVARLGPRFGFDLLGPDGHPGSGPSRVRNHGIGTARGRFLCFCDDDDYWCDPDHLAVAAQALTAAGADLYIASQRAERDGAEIFADWLPGLTRLAPHRPRVGPHGVVRLARADLTRSPETSHVNTLIVSRDLAMALGGFWDKTDYEEDLDFYFRVVDRAATILFRPAVVSVHTVPAADGHDNASSPFRGLDKWTFRALVCGHVASVAASPDMVARAIDAEGDAWRHISLLLLQQGRQTAARRFAWQALGARFSFKWLAYTLWLAVRPARPPLPEHTPAAALWPRPEVPPRVIP